MIEVDHPLDEFRREGAHAAIVEQIDPGRPPLAVLEHGVIAEMRVAVDHPVLAERVPPGAEHGAGDLVALFERAAGVIEEPPSFEPSHGEQPFGGKLRDHLGHADQRIALEDAPVEPRVAGFEIVVELLAQPRRDLLQHLGGLDRRAHAAMDREEDGELRQVGFDRRLHVGILQLGGKRAAVMRARAMHLPERGRRRRLMLEAREFRLPVRPELRRHAPSHERPAHRRRLALQLAELGGIFRRQRLGDGGEQLRHLHDRTFQTRQAPRRARRHPFRFRARARTVAVRRCAPPRSRHWRRPCRSAAPARSGGSSPCRTGCRSSVTFGRFTAE